MLNLELAIIWGTKLERIRGLLNQTEELNIGLYIHSLRYDSLEKEKEEKKKYLEGFRKQVEEINKEVRSFNKFQLIFGTKHKFAKIASVDFKRIREIVAKHKGDYPTEKGLNNFSKEFLGETDSASSLARKHTALQLRNALMPVRLSMGEFVESLRDLGLPFLEAEKQKIKIRETIKKEIDKAKVAFSVGLNGEAVFIIGRTLECLLSEFLYLLKAINRKELKNVSIQKWDFDQKLNFLFHKLKVITPNQYAKLLSIKWDRNTFGHKLSNFGGAEKDAKSNIQTGINLIIEIEDKIKALKDKRTAVRSASF